MKYLMTAALATAAFFMVQAADSFFRTDLDGRKNHIELMPGSNDSVKAENPMRDGEAQRELIYATGKTKLSSTEWKEYEFSFTPSVSGSISIAVKGQWSQKPENRGWVLVNRISVNGKLVKNGDFKQFWRWKAKNNKQVPNEFVLGEKAQYLQNAGKDMTPAVLVNHDNPVFLGLNVEAGKTYTVKCLVKAK